MKLDELLVTIAGSIAGALIASLIVVLFKYFNGTL